MRLNEFDFFIAEALIGMKRSSLMAFLTILTMSISLIVFGVFLLLTINLNNLVNFAVSKLEIRAYLANNITDENINSLIQKVESLKEVKNVSFINKENAWDAFSKQYGNIDIQAVIEDNPLPNALKIKLYDTSKTKEMVTFLKSFKEITDTTYGGVVAERISLFANITKYIGLALVILLTLATLFIIINTIRLTIIARQDEINIMHLVGATDAFIKAPFLIEGLIMGIFSGIVTILFLRTTYFFIALKIQNILPYFPLVFDKNLLYILYLIIFLTGAILGLFGAYISVSHSLKRSKNG